MRYGKAWHLLNAQMKRSLKNYAEEAHVSKTTGDMEGYHKWDERANALQTLKDWFDILDKEIQATLKEDRHEPREVMEPAERDPEGQETKSTKP